MINKHNDDSSKKEEDELHKGRYTEDQKKASEAQDEHKQRYKEKTSDHSKEGQQPEQEYEFSDNYEKPKKKSLSFILKVLRSLRAALLRALFKFSKKNKDIEEYLLRSGGGKTNSKMVLHSFNNEKDLAKKIILIYLLFLRKQMMANVLRKLIVQESQLRDYVSARIKDNVKTLQDVSCSEKTQNVIQLAEKDSNAQLTASKLEQAKNMLGFKVVIVSVQRQHNLCFPIQHPEHNISVNFTFVIIAANTIIEKVVGIVNKGTKEITNSLEDKLALVTKLGKQTADLIMVSIAMNTIVCEKAIQERSPQAQKNQGTCEVKMEQVLKINTNLIVDEKIKSAENLPNEHIDQVQPQKRTQSKNDKACGF